MPTLTLPPAETVASTVLPDPSRAPLAAPSPVAPVEIRPPVRWLWLAWIALAVAYFIVGKLGLRMAFVHPSATAVWPASGLALSALLALGVGAWPGVFLGAFAVNLTTAGSMVTTLGIATGNTLEAVVGAYLLQRFSNGRRPFDRGLDTLRFALLAGMVSTTISATFGVSSLVLSGFAVPSSFSRIWLTWWLGDMGGDLLVAPLLLLWIFGGRLRWNRSRALEALLLLGCMSLVASAVFGGAFPLGGSQYSLAFVCTPFLIWAAYRFDQRTAASAVATLAVIAVWGTLRNADQLARWERNESLLLLQVFLGVCGVTTLALAAEVANRRRVEQALRTRSAELRAAVSDLETFSHAISHDLRSPIGAVINYSAALRDNGAGILSPQQTDLLDRIRDSTASAAELLEQMMQFGSIGREVGRQQDIDMTELARRAFAEVVVGYEQAQDVQLEVRELPASRGSSLLLGRVFRNLFSNAVKYSRGRPRRSIHVTGEEHEIENIYCVADNGIGFDPAFGRDVFKPFRRLTEARGVDGAGLGLAITARIVRQHGGRIWAESDGRRGAQFFFTLPRHGESS
jgi:signal transduction histidine kinase